MSGNNTRRGRAVLAAAISAALVSPAAAGLVDVVYFGPAVDFWSNGANWSTGFAPNNGFPSGDTYRVHLDNGHAQNSTVTLNMDVTLHNVNVSAGDHLIIQDNRLLRIVGDVTNSDCFNDGTITIGSTVNFSDYVLNATNNNQLHGWGTTRLQNHARLYSATGGRITFQNQTIAGDGQVGVNIGRFTNRWEATVRADSAGKTLTLDPGNLSDAFVNEGHLLASNGGILVLTGSGGGAFQNVTVLNPVPTGIPTEPPPASVTGTIRAEDGSEVRLISGASVTGGILATSGSGIIRNMAGHTITLADLTNSGTFRAEDNTTTNLAGTINNTASFTIQSGVNLTDAVISGPGVTFSGGGTVNLNSSNAASNARIHGAGRLTNLDNVIRGQGSLGVNAIGITNESGGRIDADVLGRTLTLDPALGNDLLNHGIIQASNGGSLLLSGNGGGAFANSNIIQALAGSEVRLTSGATISGGTVTTEGTGVVRNLPGHTATLGDLTNAGSFFAGDNTATRLAGTINNTATITIEAGVNLTDAVIVGPAVMLGGGGTLSLNSSNTSSHARIHGAGRLTNVDNLIAGQGNIGANTIGITNEAAGRIEAIANGRLLTLDPANGNDFVNNGVLRARNGGILSISGNGGGAFLNNNLIEALDASEVQLHSGAAVLGGTFSSGGSGVVRVNAGQSVSLSDVTNAAGFISNDNSTTSLFGTIHNTADLTLAAGGNGTRIDASSAIVTLSGGGTVHFNSSGAASNAQLAGIAGARLVNHDNTIRGQGNLGVNTIGITNQAAGLIEADVAGRTLIIDPASGNNLINDGIIQARNGGTLLLTGSGGGGFTNNHLIRALAGSEVQLTSSVAISGGNVAGVDSGIVRLNPGQVARLTDLTLAGNITANDNAALQLGGTITNQGAMTLAAAGNLTDIQLATAAMTLAGGGVVNLNSSTTGSNARIVSVVGLVKPRLTNQDNTLRGQGNIGSNAIAVTNQAAGLIHADVAGRTLTLDPADIAGTNEDLLNLGTMQASNGGMLLLTGSGGGAFTNQGLIHALDGSQVQLTAGATVLGGTFATFGNGTIRNNGGQTAHLDGFTLNGSFIAADNSATHFYNTITNGGSITAAAGSNLTDLLVSGGGTLTLTGGGTVNLTSSVAASLARLHGSGTLLNVNNTIRGEGAVGGNAIGIVNQSLIAADVEDRTLTIDPSLGGHLANTGTLRASGGGTLLLTGSGGGVFNNAGGTIEALAGSAVRLASGASVSGGMLTADPAGAVRVNLSQTVTLGSLTLSGPVIAEDNSFTNVTGAIHNTGSFTLAAGGNLTDLAIAPAGATFSGAGIVNLDSSTASSNARIHGSGTLFNADNRIRGQGNIGGNAIPVRNQAAGVMDADVTARTLILDPSSAGGLINDGILRASNGGILVLTGSGAGTFTNNNIIEARLGSEVRLLSGASVVGGTLQTPDAGGFFRVAAGHVSSLTNLTNAGRLFVDDNVQLNLAGTITNDGLMYVRSNANLTDVIVPTGATLAGTGTLTLTNLAAPGNARSRIHGGGRLTVGSTIDGHGQVGANTIPLTVAPGGLVHANQAGGTLILDPSNTADAFVNQGTLRASAGGTLQFTGNGGGAFDSLAGAIDVAAGGTATVISGAVLNAADVTVDGTLSVQSGAVSAANVTGAGAVNVTGGTITADHFRVASLSISNATATVRSDGTGDGVTTLASLTLGTGGKLHLGDNDLIVDYTADPDNPLNTPEFPLRDLVKAARVAGSTRGIYSTPGATRDNVVLAIVDNVEWGRSSFNDIPIDTDTVVGKYTYFGDANLDGKVTGDDYVAVDSNLGVGNSWIEGDFNMDGRVSGDDYVAIDTNLGSGTPDPLSFAELKAEMVAMHVAMFGVGYLEMLAAYESETSAVPEPGGVGGVVGLACGFLRRRRRTRTAARRLSR